MINIVRKIKSGIFDFFNGLAILLRSPQGGEGDRKLAKMSKIVMAQIPFYGKNVVRMQVIKSIESDLKRASKKGRDAVDAMVKNARSTPEYMTMLRKLNLDDSHLYVMAAQAKRAEGKHK